MHKCGYSSAKPTSFHAQMLLRCAAEIAWHAAGKGLKDDLGIGSVRISAASWSLGAGISRQSHLARLKSITEGVHHFQGNLSASPRMSVICWLHELEVAVHTVRSDCVRRISGCRPVHGNGSKMRDGGDGPFEQECEPAKPRVLYATSSASH